MSMECDTRLSMMAMQERAQRTTPAAPRRRSTVRRYSATAAASMAAFALTLFTRGA